MVESAQAKVVPFAERIALEQQRNMPFGLATPEPLRMAEALIFASSQPVSERALAERMPEGTDIADVLGLLRAEYAMRGVNLMKIGDAWAFRTAPDLSFLLNRDQVQQKKLSRAALEVLAIIAYHQPVTRAEMEDIRGVETAKGTMDLILETGWIRLRGRRKSPGRPVTYGTTATFLDHFGLEDVRDLPGIEELKGSGLLSPRMPSNFAMPNIPDNLDDLTDDEDPFTDIDLEELGLLTPKGGND
jgi:segregation and condensation protein B